MGGPAGSSGLRSTPVRLLPVGGNDLLADASAIADVIALLTGPLPNGCPFVGADNRPLAAVGVVLGCG